MKLQNSVCRVYIGEKCDKIINFTPPATALSVLSAGGVAVDAPCGGNGRCGRCKMTLRGQLAAPDAAERDKLTAAELENDVRLACLCVAQGDFSVHMTQAGEATIQVEGGIVPLKTAAEISCESGGEGWQIKRGEVILDTCPTRSRLYGCAVDIGTTTVVAYLFDLESGERIGAVSELSAQRGYGADVISRIHAVAELGTAPLQAAICGQLNEMSRKLAEAAGIKQSEIYAMSICGNTVMEHLLTGLDPSAIAVAPFTPQSLFGDSRSPAELSIAINPRALIYILPCVSGYVGGDITAGVLACGMGAAQKPCLLLDIGTNGEIALGCGEKIYYCSAAAGPAFEGAHISDGVGGIEGAINRVYLTDEGKIAFETLGGGRATGICGSGIIDAAALMVKIGAVDETGRLVDPDELEEKWLPNLDDDNRKFIIDPSSGIGLTDRDIRQIQLAKAAIAAGIQTLVAKATFGGSHITLDDIDSAYLAGGFGTHLSPESGCAIGLMPQKLLERVKAVGNSAGAGAAMTLLDGSLRDTVGRLAKEGEYIELSSDPEFNDRYIDNMCFEI